MLSGQTANFGFHRVQHSSSSEDSLFVVKPKVIASGNQWMKSRQPQYKETAATGQLYVIASMIQAYIVEYSCSIFGIDHSFARSLRAACSFRS
jgi:hypothetical protein